MSRRFQALIGLGVFAVSTAAILISDIFIRGHHIPGTDPDSWDWFGSIFSTVGIAFIANAMFRHEPDLTTKEEVNDNRKLRALLCRIWFYCDWAWVTRNLPDDEKDLWADVLDDDRRGTNLREGLLGTDRMYQPIPRWWGEKGRSG